MVLFVRTFYYLLQASFILTGLQRCERFPLLSFVLRTSHILWLATVVFLMFYRRLSGGDTSVGGLVGTASFVCIGSVNILIILESIFKLDKFRRILQLQREVDGLMSEELHTVVQNQFNFCGSVNKLVWMFLLQLVCDGLKLWINTISRIQPVFWYTVPIRISLRTRYFQLIYTIMELNGRVETYKDALQSVTEQNEAKSLGFNDIWQPYTDEEYDKVNYMRLIYMRIWEAYRAINDCYGWSILFLSMASFFDAVCNSYWTFTAIYKGQVFHKYVFNGATSISVVSLVIMLFHYTDASDNNSRYIGCLISKLVKPLGNKRYNDLVSEFSVQTLHQRFVITAKEFFSLNLGLLGSMVAAIVTYLVILIQFMFTERSSKDHNKITKKIATKTLNVLMANLSEGVETALTTYLYSGANNASAIEATTEMTGDNTAIANAN